MVILKVIYTLLQKCLFLSTKKDPILLEPGQGWKSQELFKGVSESRVKNLGDFNEE